MFNQKSLAQTFKASRKNEGLLDGELGFSVFRFFFALKISGFSVVITVAVFFLFLFLNPVFGFYEKRFFGFEQFLFPVRFFGFHGNFERFPVSKGAYVICARLVNVAPRILKTLQSTETSNAAYMLPPLLG